LNPLRVFEAAARHNSFILAANELCVTPGAVSRQVKALEDYLGFQLFIRVHNGIEITPFAQDYQESLRAAFLLMEKSTRDLLAGKNDGPLNVWCSRLFMRQWLVPRLASFQELYPAQEVRLMGGRSDESLPSDTDLAIRWGEGPYEPWISHFIMDSHTIPVCSPEYLSQHARPQTPADLLDHTLLFTVTRLDDWAEWFASAGVREVVIPKRLTLEGDGLAYRAAVEGLGIAVGRLEFLEPDLKAGRLVTPFSHSLRLQGSFNLIYPPSFTYPKKVIAFRDWLLREAEKPWHHQSGADETELRPTG